MVSRVMSTDPLGKLLARRFGVSFEPAGVEVHGACEDARLPFDHVLKTIEARTGRGPVDGGIAMTAGAVLVH